jgi:hypothetical protein
MSKLLDFKFYLITFTLGVILGAFAFYKLFKPQPQIVKDTQVITDVKTVIKTITKVIEKPDGTKETVTENSTESEKKDSSLVINKKTLPNYRLGPMLGYTKSQEWQFGVLGVKPLSENYEFGGFLKTDSKFNNLEGGLVLIKSF